MPARQAVINGAHLYEKRHYLPIKGMQAEGTAGRLSELALPFPFCESEPLITEGVWEW